MFACFLNGWIGIWIVVDYAARHERFRRYRPLSKDRALKGGFPLNENKALKGWLEAILSPIKPRSRCPARPDNPFPHPLRPLQFITNGLNLGATRFAPAFGPAGGREAELFDYALRCRVIRIMAARDI